MSVSLANMARRSLTGLLQPVMRPLVAGLMKGSACSGLITGGWARSIASVQGDKLRGNVREAWEMREVEKIVGTRNPAYFEDFEVGDSIAVRYVNPYNPKRLLTFSGVCIAKRGSLLGTAFTLQNNLEGVGVCQHFPYYAPLIKGIQVVKRPAKYPRRAKLYNIRERPPKEWTVNVSEAELTRLPKEVY